MRTCIARTLVRTLSALALCGSADPGLAQNVDTSSNSAASLQEIVVTATRRAERLQDVPVSVTAFSQENMDLQGVRSIDDVARISPGVTFQRNGSGSSANYNDENSDINIRGIDSPSGTATTGIYIDDTPIQNRHIGFGSVSPFPALFDLDRVEVLRGPQGTLFGAGAEGGAIRFITPQPGLQTYTGYVRMEGASTYGGAASYESGAAVGGPIIDDMLGFRVSASFRHDGGYVDRVSYTRANDNPTTLPTYLGTVADRSNWQETSTLRAALKWKLSDAISVTPSFYYQKLHINDTASFWASLSDPESDTFRNGNALSNPSTDPFWLAAVKLDWNLGFAQLTSNTSYFSRSQHSTSDYTQYLRVTFLGNPFPAPGDAGYAPFSDKQNDFYQEVRLTSANPDARTTWNVGIFYSHQNENVATSMHDLTLNAETGGALCAVVACPDGVLLTNPTNRVVDQQTALFGEASLKITSTLKGTLGLRVSKVDYTGTDVQGGAFVGLPYFATQAAASEKPVTPKAVLSWQPERDQLLYASAAKGYRVGGVNADVGAVCGDDLASIGIPLSSDGLHHVPKQYSSDSLWSYEIGAKNTLLERRLQINSSLFIIDWKNIQQNVYLPDCGNQFVANLGRVRSQGGEMEAQLRATEALVLSFTAEYVDAKFTKSSCAGTLIFNGAGCVGGDSGATAPLQPIVSAGNRLLGAPWRFFVGAEYSFMPGSERTPYLRMDYQYATAQRDLLSGQDPRNALSDPTIPGLPIVQDLSLRAGLRWNGLDVSLFAQNVTDQHPILFKSRDIANSAIDQLYFERSTRPRTLGLTATYRF